MITDLKGNSQPTYRSQTQENGSQNEGNAVTSLWRCLLSRMDIDIFTRTLVAAIPLTVQEFFASPQWDANDLLAFEGIEPKSGTIIFYRDFCIKYAVYDNDDQEM
jgi:hypothetical protein